MDFSVMPAEKTASLSVAQNALTEAAVATREMQEVQGAIIVARQFPRDQKRAYDRIIAACERPKLAAEAMYAYRRGKELVTGPSIRLAEVLAQNWGNLSFGVRQLSKTDDESIMQAYCWDLETNVRQERTFSVRHFRDTKSGGYTLTSERDIYELVANLGARRMRACILGVIPRDVADSAIEQCEKTLAGTESLRESVPKMIAAFQAIKVSTDDIEHYLAKKVSQITMSDFVKLRKIYKSIEDGIAEKSEFFEPRHEPEKIKKEMEKAAKEAPALSKEELDELRKEIKNHALKLTKAGHDVDAILGMKYLDALKLSDKAKLESTLLLLVEEVRDRLTTSAEA